MSLVRSGRLWSSTNRFSLKPIPSSEAKHCDDDESVLGRESSSFVFQISSEANRNRNSKLETAFVTSFHQFPLRQPERPKQSSGTSQTEFVTTCSACTRLQAHYYWLWIFLVLALWLVHLSPIILVSDLGSAPQG